MKKEKAYPSDQSDSEWSIIEPLLPKAKRYGRRRKREINEREIVNAILYLLQEGCKWRLLPSRFSSLVNGKNLRAIARSEKKCGTRNSKPSTASLDSQSIKTTGKSPKGFPTLKG